MMDFLIKHACIQGCIKVDRDQIKRYIVRALRPEEWKEADRGFYQYQNTNLTLQTENRSPVQSVTYEVNLKLVQLNTQI